MNARRMMTADERAEYDALVERACFDPLGKPYKTGEAADRLRLALDDAEQAHRPWAEWVRADALFAGLSSLATKARAQKRITTNDGASGKAPRQGINSLRRITPSGVVEWQPKLIDDMSRDEVAELLDLSVRRQKGNRTTVRTHKAILKLMDRHPGAATVRDALAAEGMTMDDYLASAA